jgi:SOS-response transcriptional repressor LexA
MARVLDIPPTTLANYERGVCKIPMDVVGKLVDLHNVNPRWLFWGRREKYLPVYHSPSGNAGADLLDEVLDENDKLNDQVRKLREESHPYGAPPAVVIPPPGVDPRRWAKEHTKASTVVQEMIAVPILAGNIAAGSPTDVFEREIEDWAITYRGAIRNPKTTSAIWVRGDSMTPHIPDGSLVWIDYSRRDPEEILHSRHRIAAIRADEGCTLRWVEKANGHWVFRPENPSDTNRLYVWAPAEGENPIVGKLVALWAKYD